VDLFAAFVGERVLDTDLHIRVIGPFDGDLCSFMFAGTGGFCDHFDSSRQGGNLFLSHGLSFLVQSETLPLMRRLLVPLWLFVVTFLFFRLQRFWLRTLLLLCRTRRFRRTLADYPSPARCRSAAAGCAD
jgi:hypothetical protein